jgi:peptidoglycan/xylan/chitin deacetylase (PgdA/CDA1 family)
MVSTASVVGTCLRHAARRLPAGLLRRLTGARLIAPLYHAVTEDEPPPHLKHLVCCRDAAVFRRDLDFLLAHFQPVALEDVCGYLERRSDLPPNAVFVSCDDGLREAAEVIAPACRQKGIPVTFFLTTGFLDNRNLGDRQLASLLVEKLKDLSDARQQSLLAKLRGALGDTCGDHGDLRVLLLRQGLPRAVLDQVAELLEVDVAAYLRTVRPYLETAEVEQLLAAGFAIGAHSVDHPPYWLLRVEEQVRQTLESLQYLCERFATASTAFAFPFSADGVGPVFFQAVDAAVANVSYFAVGPMPPHSGSHVVDRMAMDSTTDRPPEELLHAVYATRLSCALRRRLRRQMKGTSQ